MAKTLIQIKFALLPDPTGVGYSNVEASYSLGSTDDATLQSNKKLTMTLGQGDYNKVQALFSGWLTQVKASEGIK